MVAGYKTKRYIDLLQEMYRAVVMQIFNSLMNPFDMEKRLIQHKTKTTTIKIKKKTNIHDFFACKNEFTLNVSLNFYISV